MDKIVAVTVTFNDFEYLTKALDALRKQTIPIYKIVVVDNNSSDENKKLLKKEEDEQVEVLWLDENLGGAGGFEAGMRYAEKYDADWYWIMDADAYPEHDCAEKLLQHKNEENVGILCPLIYGVDLKKYQLYHHKKMPKFLYKDLDMFDSIESVPAVSKIDADAFVGPLISGEVVKELGVADGSLFIYGDDTDYTYRTSRVYNVLLIKDAVINHRDQPVQGVHKPQNWWKDYYTFRNRLLFINKYAPNGFDKFVGNFLVGLRLLKQYILSFTLPYNKNMKKFRRSILIKGYVDGIKQRSGKIVDPTQFRGELSKYE